MNASLQELRNVLADIFHKARLARKEDGIQIWQSVLDMYDAAVEAEEESGAAPRIIGVYGSPNVGKSTLLNSLVREAILPVGQTPVTGTLIDLHRQEGAGSRYYHVYCYRDGRIATDIKTFSTVEGVRKELEGIAAQKREQDYERVVVKGPFPNAMEFFRPGYILRDTPGAISGEALREAQREDSRRALQSTGDVLLPLFCVRGDTMGDEADAKLYRTDFRNRICLHVITYCDEPENEQEIRDAFCESFGIREDEVDRKLIVCTGKSSTNAPFATHGLEHLVEDMDGYLNSDKLGQTLLKIADCILRECNPGGKKWNPAALGFPIPVVQLERLNKRYSECANHG